MSHLVVVCVYAWMQAVLARRDRDLRRASAQMAELQRHLDRVTLAASQLPSPAPSPKNPPRSPAPMATTHTRSVHPSPKPALPRSMQPSPKPVRAPTRGTHAGSETAATDKLSQSPLLSAQRQRRGYAQVSLRRQAPTQAPKPSGAVEQEADDAATEQQSSTDIGALEPDAGDVQGGSGGTAVGGAQGLAEVQAAAHVPEWLQAALQRAQLSGYDSDSTMGSEMMRR